MSSLLAFENSEVLQHDPARAGIFNPETLSLDNKTSSHSLLQAELLGGVVLSSSTEIDNWLYNTENPECIADDVTSKLEGYFNTEKLEKAFEGTIKSGRQLLMVSALIVQNGEMAYINDITRPFTGNADELKKDFLAVVRCIGKSEYAEQLVKYGRGNWGYDTKYRFGDTWYPEEYKEFMLDELALRISNLESVQKSKAVTRAAYRRKSSNNWPDSALCAQTDPEDFFPEKGVGAKIAKKICSMCDVRLDCLYDAIENAMEYEGIRAGFTYDEIGTLRKSVDLS